MIMRPIEPKQTLNVFNNLAIRDQANIGSLTYVALTSSIVQAVGDTNSRIGDEVMLKSLEIRYLFKNDPTNTGQAQLAPVIRFVVFQYHPQLDGTYATLNTNLPLSTIFEVGATGGGVPDPMSLYKWDTRQEYTILHDEVKLLASSGNAGGVPPINNDQYQVQGHLHVSLRKAKRKVHWQAASTVLATNQIMIAVFQYNSSATTPPTAFLTSRLAYTDA